MENNFDKCLKERLYRFNCPSADELGDFYLEILPDAIQKRIKEHLEFCFHCRNELRVLEEFDQAEDNEISSETAMLAVKELFIKISRHIQTVIYNPQPGLSALRGEDRRRHLHYKLEPETAGDEKLDMYLGFEELESGYTIQVQCLPFESGSGILHDALVEIWQEGDLVDTAVINNYFNFRFQLQDLSPLVIRITNETKLIYTFQVRFKG